MRKSIMPVKRHWGEIIFHNFCYFNYLLMYNLTIFFLHFFCEQLASLDLLSYCKDTVLALDKA